MKYAEVYAEAEEIVGDLIADMNPVNIETGKKIDISEEEFTKVWDEAVRRICVLVKLEKGVV